jgi:hypothetical protein
MKSTKDQEEQTLNSFIKALGNNIGFSLTAKPTSKKIFNPFAVDNSESICLLYTLMSNYSKKIKEEKIEIPNNVTVISGNPKKLKFIFNSELDSDKIGEVLEEKGINNVSLDESNKTIEIVKPQPKKILNNI